MSVHVLLNVLSKLVKRDKVRGLSSILSLFRKKYNKFNYNDITGARLLDSIYHTLWHFCDVVPGHQMGK